MGEGAQHFFFAAAVFVGGVTLACTPAAGARSDGGDPKISDASAALVDAASSAVVAAAVDAGPADDGLPSSISPDLPVRGRHLLEAIALKLDLVGINIPGQLSNKERALLMRQAVQQAKKSLAAALAEFRNALAS